MKRNNLFYLLYGCVTISICIVASFMIRSSVNKVENFVVNFFFLASCSAFLLFSILGFWSRTLGASIRNTLLAFVTSAMASAQGQYMAVIFFFAYPVGIQHAFAAFQGVHPNDVQTTHWQFVLFWILYVAIAFLCIVAKPISLKRLIWVLFIGLLILNIFGCSQTTASYRRFDYH